MNVEEMLHTKLLERALIPSSNGQADPYTEVPHPADTEGGELDRPGLRHRLLSVTDLANMPTPQPIVHHLLDFDSVALAYGRRGCGKSFVAVDLTAAIASGTRWHGRRTTQTAGLYVVAEGAAGLGQRYDAWQDRNLGTAILRDLMILPEAVNLLSPSTVGEFADMAVELGARLIVLDTLARCMVGGDENSAKDAGIAVEQLDVIRRRTGACVIAVHHAGKNIDNGARGSSAFEAAADTVLEIGMTDDILTVVCTKQKNHVAPNPIRLRLRPTARSAVLEEYRVEGSEMPESVVETLRALRDIETPDGVATSKWAMSVTTNPRTFYRHVKRLLDDSLIVNTGTKKIPKYLLTEVGREVADTTDMEVT